MRIEKKTHAIIFWWSLLLGECAVGILELCSKTVSKMDVSKNKATPKSSILRRFSITNHPFWGYPYFWKHPDAHCLGDRKLDHVHLHDK